LLRTVSGYIAAPRMTAAASNVSKFDRILVMATAVAPRPAVSAASAAPVFQPPPPVVNDDPDDAPGGARPPIFGSFPQPQAINPQGVMPPGFQPGFQPPGYVPPQQGVGGQPQQQPNTPTNTFGAPTGVA